MSAALIMPALFAGLFATTFAVFAGGIIWIMLKALIRG